MLWTHCKFLIVSVWCWIRISCFRWKCYQILVFVIDLGPYRVQFSVESDVTWHLTPSNSWFLCLKCSWLLGVEKVNHAGDFCLRCPLLYTNLSLPLYEVRLFCIYRMQFFCILYCVSNNTSWYCAKILVFKGFLILSCAIRQKLALGGFCIVPLCDVDSVLMQDQRRSKLLLQARSNSWVC